jgi:hypothetical protein
MGGDLPGAERAEHDEPHHHDGPEQASDRPRAESLQREEPDQDREREGDDLRGERRRGHVQAGHGRDDRDCGREHPVAVDSDAPSTPTITRPVLRRPFTARSMSATSAMIPPSPPLSTRRIRSTYLSVTTSASAQKMSESAP